MPFLHGRIFGPLGMKPQEIAASKNSVKMRSPIRDMRLGRPGRRDAKGRAGTSRLESFA